MKIAFLGDKTGRVHYNRYTEFVRHIQKHTFTFFELNEKSLSKKCAKFDAVYYASATMYLKEPIKHGRLFGSFTSWKCVNDKNSRAIWNKCDNFRRLSVNNRQLFEDIKRRTNNVSYIHNGVDTDFFIPSKMIEWKLPLVIGWVGNSDRKEKNYDTVFMPLVKRKLSDIRFVSVVTKKSSSSLKSREKMRSFYQSLHFFLVTSSFEGTPNPALEAASCGIPVISTVVGNMPELILQGFNGYLTQCAVVAISRQLAEIRNTYTEELYRTMRTNMRNSIVSAWTWAESCKLFEEFFGD